jgi:Holliday junction resolvase RusA-like endonuclease
MESTKIWIPIQPIGAPRPRVTRNGTYNDPKYTSYKKAIALYCSHKFGISDKPIAMYVTFCFEQPKSWSKKKKAETSWHTSKPDIDNIQKGLKDALNGVAYIDDSQICYVIARKQYAEQAGIMLEIKELML